MPAPTPTLLVGQSDEKLTAFENWARGYNAGWCAAIAAIRLELAKPHKPSDGLLDHVLDQFEREHSVLR